MICIYYIYFYSFFYMKMADKKQLFEFTTNSVKIVDDAIVILFTSDWTEKKKTMPLTEKGLSLKKGLEKIFAMDEYDPSSIWTDVKEWGRLYDCVIDLAKEAKAKQALVDDAFAELWLAKADPIDEL